MVDTKDLKSFASRRAGSSPAPGTIQLAFVQWIGQESSKLLMGVRFPHAGPHNYE